MFSFSPEVVREVLGRHVNEGVDLLSAGNPRDGFELNIKVPHWTSGFGGTYEMVHTNVPTGTMIAVGDVAKITDISDFEKLKDILRKIDIYPTGHLGDFTGKDVSELKKWFFDRSIIDDAANNQEPLSGVKKLTPAGLGLDKYNELVGYLAGEMTIFKDPKAAGKLVPPSLDQRKEIVKGLLDGLSKTVRYTRIEEPAKAYRFIAPTIVNSTTGAEISISLEPNLLLVDRLDRKNVHQYSPLNPAMLGQGWVTRDHKPLGDRGAIDISEFVEQASKRGLPFFRFNPKDMPQPN